MADDDTVCVDFRRFNDDIALMIGHRPNYYWVVCWLAVTPLIILVKPQICRNILKIPYLLFTSYHSM